MYKFLFVWLVSIDCKRHFNEKKKLKETKSKTCQYQQNPMTGRKRLKKKKKSVSAALTLQVKRCHCHDKSRKQQKKSHLT